MDEAAAIPLPTVRQLLGPYLVFLSSTVNGYEGTGRSLSLKLINDLRTRSGERSIGGRVLREVALDEPIRYKLGDPVEKWLNDLLCLDVSSVKNVPSGAPHPDKCELCVLRPWTCLSHHRLVITSIAIRSSLTIALRNSFSSA